jgi:hypothetical protein
MKKALARLTAPITPPLAPALPPQAPAFPAPRRRLGTRLAGGLTLLTLLAAVGLFASSRPAHTAGGPIPVSIANTVVNRDADGPAKQPFQMVYSLYFPGGTGNHTFVTVPTGKRLVIESLTADYNVSGDKNSYSVALASSSPSSFTGVVGLSLTPSAEPYSIKTQPVRLTAEAADDVTVYVNSNQADSNDNIQVSISGYYVDVP